VQTILEQKETKVTKNRSPDQSSGQTWRGIVGIVKTTSGGPRPNGRILIDD
jgi:hypothetical protein